MNSEVQIERRFALTKEKQLSDPDYLDFMGNRSSGVKQWNEVLAHSPTVILAEGRAGKTYEFKRQVEQLIAANRTAFFIPLERLYDEELEDAMEMDDLEVFKAWKESSEREAYFFFDALDELKLREGTFRKALKKIAKAIGSDKSRSIITISCRPADWNENIDSGELAAFCVSNSVNAEKSDVDPEAKFLEIVSKDDVAEDEKENDDQNGGIDRSKVQIVSLLSLSNGDVDEFAKKYAPKFAQDFLNHLEKDDLWQLYRLPVEIIDGLDQLKAGKPLGQLEEQVAFGIENKLSETAEKKANSLSLDKAIEGAERLALALFLLKRRSFRIDGDENDEVLNVGQVLTDWTNTEQKELIGRPLFDPSGIGAVRFHHRSSQEYLAAKKLLKLHENGMAPREFFELMFTDVGDEKVVKPSMAPIAAWLSLWLPEVFKKVLQREPALLLMQGLPSALPIDLKEQILHSYVNKFANRDWCRTGVDSSNLRRVSSPELADTIRELWIKAYSGYDSRELLIDFIWAGEISECTDLSLQAALDNEIGSTHQIYASWGVIDAGTNEQREQLSKSVLSNKVSEGVTRNILPKLVPEAISTTEAFSAIEGMQQVPNNVHGLNYTIYQVSHNANIQRDHLIKFRNSLAKSIWQNRKDGSKMYQAHSCKDHYQDGLIAACAGTLPKSSDEVESWAWSFAIAEHFGERSQSIIAEVEHKLIWSNLQSDCRLREQYFRACLKMSDDLEGLEDDWPRFIRSIGTSRPALSFNGDDKPWLLKELSISNGNGNRGVIFAAITYFFNLQDEPHFTTQVKEAAKDRSDWLERIEEILNPKPPEPQDWEIQRSQHEEEFKQKEQKRISNWQEWRKEILNDEDFSLSGDQRLNTLYDAQKIIGQATGVRGSWGQWNAEVIESTLGAGFLKRYREELSQFWRDTQVQLVSERPANKKSTYYNSWLLALTAVKAEAEIPGWAERLSTDEAQRAFRIAFIELNGFGSFYEEIDRVHPVVVEHVISNEAIAQFDQLSDTSQADLYHDVFYHGNDNIKSALAKSVAPKLAEGLKFEEKAVFGALDYAVRVIASHGSQDDIALAINALRENRPLENFWAVTFRLTALAELDAELGCYELLEQTAKLDTNQQRSEAISAFASVLGDRGERRSIDLNAIKNDLRITLTKDLVVRAYQAVRRDEDETHEGVYTPNERDAAQDARSFLFETLLAIRQPEILTVLHELAQMQEFSHMTDRLKQMAYETAAQIADIEAFPLASFRTLDSKNAFIPFDDKTLHVAMMARLDRFEHDILHAEDTPVDALRKVDQETGLRRFITHWLRKDAHRAFTFTQEAVVLDEKRTDIRFQPSSISQYATVELKLETWTLAQFEKALRDQLVGQYLQHEKCSVGCLLICQREKRRWHSPTGGPMWDLSQVVEHLQSIANQIVYERPNLHLEVKGINYSS